MVFDCLACKFVTFGIPVLMYHKIGDDKDNDAVIREDLFREQMKFLKDNGYNPLTMDQLYEYVVNGAAVPEKPVGVTLLQERVATLHGLVGHVRHAGCLTGEDLRSASAIWALSISSNSSGVRPITSTIRLS